MLVMQHARRHVNRIALIPIIAFAADLGITVAFERVKIGFGMSVAVALGVAIDGVELIATPVALKPLSLPLRPIKK